MISVRAPYRGLLAAVVLALPSGAAAQLAEPAARSALPAFRVPPSCPDAASWVNEVLARLEPEARERGRRELSELVEAVEVTSDGKGASLWLRGADEPRVIAGEACEEVLAGAALVAALAFGLALPSRQATPREPGATGAPLELPATAVTPESDGPTADMGTRGAAGATMSRAPALKTSALRPATSALRPAISAGASGQTGLAPWPAGLLDGAFELSWPGQGWSLRARGVLGLARASLQDRSARFQYVGGALDACPVVFGTHLDWQWRTCGVVELGRVHASGVSESALRTGYGHDLWWSALGLLARLQSPRVYGLRVELEGGASVPIWHREFEFEDPDATVFETPMISMSARLGLQVPLE